MEESLESSFCTHLLMDYQLREVKFVSPSLFLNTECLNKTMQKTLNPRQLKRDKVHSNQTNNGVLVVGT